MVDFCVNYENQNIVFSMCIVKIFYKLLIEKLFQYFVLNIFWSEKLNLEFFEIFIKRWNVLWEFYKLLEIVELDFKLYYNVIFIYEKMFKIGKIELNICFICLLEIEDIIYMFIGCLEL